MRSTPGATDGFETAITGEFTADHDFTQLSQEDLEKGELEFGLPVALIVLVLVFGAVVAGLIPVLVALVSIVIALGLTALVGQAFDLSVYVVNMISGMGLALGIDYSLFVVSRFREERRLGGERLDAIATVGSTTQPGGAVQRVGVRARDARDGARPRHDPPQPGDGRRARRDRHRARRPDAAAGGARAPGRPRQRAPRAVARAVAPRKRRARRDGSGRGSFARVTRAPVRAAVISIGVLLLVAAPLLSIQTGLTGVRELPNRFHAKQGFTMLEQEFGVGTPDSVQVVVGGDVRSAPLRPAIAELVRRDRSGAVPSSNPRCRRARTAVSRTSRLSSPGTAATSVRSRPCRGCARSVVPEVFAGRDATVYVTGETAEVLDYRALTDRWLPIVFVFVLGLSFVLLTVAFRSIVLAAVAIGLNLLSVGAAYGLIVLVFLKGFGRELLGFTEVDVIAAWLPLFLFAVLFGLSMDYTVFLLSRIREHVAAGERDDRRRRARRRVDRADHHGRRADHHRGVRRVRRR